MRSSYACSPWTDRSSSLVRQQRRPERKSLLGFKAHAWQVPVLHTLVASTPEGWLPGAPPFLRKGGGGGALARPLTLDCACATLIPLPDDSFDALASLMPGARFDTASRRDSWEARSQRVSRASGIPGTCRNDTIVQGFPRGTKSGAASAAHSQLLAWHRQLFASFLVGGCAASCAMTPLLLLLESVFRVHHQRASSRLPCRQPALPPATPSAATAHRCTRREGSAFCVVCPRARLGSGLARSHSYMKQS